MAIKRMLPAILLVCLVVATPASAQDTDLTAVIGNVFAESAVAIHNHPTLISSGTVGDFSLGPFLAEGILSSALVIETGAFPIGSSSGGFTYFFDSTMGAPQRSSSSFGPAFAERPLTSGKGQLNVGLTYLHRKFNELEGIDLEDRSLQFYSPVSFPSGATADLIHSTMGLKVTSDTATVFATYGATDKLDLAVAVPIQRVKLDVGVSSRLFRAGGANLLNIPVAESFSSQSASGIGDIAVRAKYNVFNGEHAALAGGVDLRLPTGDERNMLGTGLTRTKLYAAVATKLPNFFPHFNFGYTFKSDESDESFFFGSEYSYAAGAEYVVHPRLTVVGDLIGRSLEGEGRAIQQTSTFNLTEVFVSNAAGVVTNLPASTVSVSELSYDPGVRLNTALAAVGVKFSPGRQFIVSAHLLLPVTKAGLRSDPAPVIGIDYTF